MLEKLRLKLAFIKLKSTLKKIKGQQFTPDEVMKLLFGKKLSLIRPWQYEEEFLNLLNQYNKLKPDYIMEIGTANGGTLFAHCKLASKNATIISVDLPGGDFGGGYPDWKLPIYKEFSDIGQSLHLIRANSHEIQTLQNVKNVLKNNLLDYLFIDGDHSYKGVKKDFDVYSPLVKKGGHIVFHDIAYHKNSPCEVDKFWRDIKSSYNTIEFVKDKESGQFGIGIIIL